MRPRSRLPIGEGAQERAICARVDGACAARNRSRRNCGRLNRSRTRLMECEASARSRRSILRASACVPTCLVWPRRTGPWSHLMAGHIRRRVVEDRLRVLRTSLKARQICRWFAILHPISGLGSDRVTRATSRVAPSAAAFLPDDSSRFAADGHRSDGVGDLGPNDGGDRPDPGPDLSGVPPVSGPILRHGTGREALGIGR